MPISFLQIWELLCCLHVPPAEGALSKELIYRPVCPCIINIRSFPGVLLFLGYYTPETAYRVTILRSHQLTCGVHSFSGLSGPLSICSLSLRSSNYSYPTSSFLEGKSIRKTPSSLNMAKGKWEYGRKCQKNILIFHKYFPTHHEIFKVEK